MMARFFNQLCLSFSTLERNIFFMVRGCIFHDEMYSGRNESLAILHNDSCKSSLLVLVPQNNSVLWAVPKKRCSIEKRLSKKFGWPHQVWKPLVTKKNLLTCKLCGNHFEAGVLCPTCYAKVKTETEEMNKLIKTEIGLNPNDKEVIILYKGEEQGLANEVLKNKLVIELTKKRPQWFSKNLLERTSKGLATTSNVKPSDLA